MVQFRNKKRGQPEGEKRHSQKLFIKQCAVAKTQREIEKEIGSKKRGSHNLMNTHSM